MRSWIFRNRDRLAALLGRPSPPVRSTANPARPPQTPRVVVRVPARHPLGHP